MLIAPTSFFLIQRLRCADESVYYSLRTKNMAVDPIFVDLQQKYQPLVGMEFSGTYQGVFTMPQTQNERNVISVTPTPLNAFATTLGGISTYVLNTYGAQIWKGITGPDTYTDYWLWVEPDGFSAVLQIGCSYNFKITQCNPFKCVGGTFTHGVSIKAITI